MGLSISTAHGIAAMLPRMFVAGKQVRMGGGGGYIGVGVQEAQHIKVIERTEMCGR